MGKKRILICGATGFIGRNIAEALAEDKNSEVYGTYFKKPPYPNRKITFLKADLRQKEQVDRVIKGKDIIIQAAATTSGSKDIISRPYHHVTDNAVMNSLILRAAYENAIKHVLFFSCTVMYQSSGKPVKEGDFDANKEIYPAYFGAGWTKVYVEKMCEFYARISDTKYTVIRHSNIYGPYDKFDPERSHVFGATVAKVLSLKPRSDITVWGSGKAERDLLYVSDLVYFVKRAISCQKDDFRIYNVGYGKAVSISSLVRKIVEASGKNLKLIYDRSRPDIKTKLCLDTQKARKELGWRPKVSLEQGIKMTLRWYEEHTLNKGDKK